jgi:hypothetical protein
MTTQTQDSTDAARAAALEVSFDGHHYHFRQYRYERLDDALRYAGQQRGMSGFIPDAAFEPRWLAPWQPSPAECAAMRQLGITLDGVRYAFGAYRYDRLEDAMAFARLQRKTQGAS